MNICFHSIDPNRIKLERPENLADSVFHNVYKSSFSALMDIVSANAASQEEMELRKTESARYPCSDSFDADEISNIIAFSGDRGSGKTTAMLSFINILKDKSSVDKALKSLGLQEMAHEPPLYFHVLPVVDPSKFGPHDSLLNMVVGRIFDSVQTILNTKGFSGSLNSEKIRAVVRDCEDTYRAIQMRNFGVHMVGYDEIEKLELLSKMSSLRGNLFKLINSYIALYTESVGGKDVKPMLVIPIDDLDVSIHRGYELAEELRNYFMLPGVLVTMAVKLEQLSDLVEQTFTEDFKTMLGQKANVLDAQPAEMAVKYIQKLIPNKRRIHLPHFTMQDMQTLYILMEKEPKKSAIDYFFELIFEKTGIVLIPNQFHSHALLPRNLRALHQTFIYLEKLDSLNPKNEDKAVSVPKPLDSQEEDEKREAKNKRLENNLNQIEHWLLDTASANAVPRDMALILRAIAEHPINNLNHYIMRQLEQSSILSDRQRIGADGKPAFHGIFDYDKEIGYMLSSIPENISMGDVFYLLHKMEQYDSSDGILHFTAAVKMIYSLKLTRCKIEKKSESRYESIQRIYNGLICSTYLCLTDGHEEWIPNIPGRTLRYMRQLDGTTVSYLDGSLAGHTVSDETFTIPRLLWLSYFVVNYGEAIRSNSIHKLTQPAVKSRFVMREGNPDVYLSIHWFNFFYSVLNPQQTQARLGIKEQFDEGPDYGRAITKWLNDDFERLPFCWADVLYQLAITLNGDLLQRIDSINRLKNYFVIRNAFLSAEPAPLLSAIAPKESYAQTHLSKAYEALLSCPLFVMDGLSLAADDREVKKLQNLLV